MLSAFTRSGLVARVDRSAASSVAVRTPAGSAYAGAPS